MLRYTTSINLRILATLRILGHAPRSPSCPELSTAGRMLGSRLRFFRARPYHAGAISWSAGLIAQDLARGRSCNLCPDAQIENDVLQADGSCSPSDVPHAGYFQPGRRRESPPLDIVHSLRRRRNAKLPQSASCEPKSASDGETRAQLFYCILQLIAVRIYWSDSKSLLQNHIADVF